MHMDSAFQLFQVGHGKSVMLKILTKGVTQLPTGNALTKRTSLPLLSVLTDCVSWPSPRSPQPPRPPDFLLTFPGAQRDLPAAAF
ncbi:hypothetical protein SRHO_G00024290 [Serrasalmus rhombeus]